MIACQGHQIIGFSRCEQVRFDERPRRIHAHDLPPQPDVFAPGYAPEEIVEIAQCFERAHELGMATILWCYLRNNAFKTDKADYHNAADLTAQANHLGCTIRADISTNRWAFGIMAS